MYSIVKITGGSFTDLVKFASSSAIHTGTTTNHITVSCVGTKLTLAVNGTVVAETTDSSYSSGDTALAATTYESTPTEYNFNNLVVTKP